MKHRSYSSLVSTLLVVAASFWLLGAKDITETLGMDLSSTQIKATPLGGPVTMLVGAGGNIAVSVGDDGVFMVDDQYAPLTERILAAVRALSDKPIQYVLNTHWHYDHSGGNRNLGALGIPLVAHDNARKRLVAGQVIEPFGTVIPPEPTVGLPEITFNDSITFHLNGEPVHVFHVNNAHTDGDSVVHFEGSNVIHTGDAYFNGMYPFIDVSSGGSIDGVIGAANAILALANDKTKIIPGHGPLSNQDELTAYRDMLMTARERMQAGMAAGKSVEEIVADKILDDLDPDWGQGFMGAAQFLKILHTDLVRAP